MNFKFMKYAFALFSLFALLTAPAYAHDLEKDKNVGALFHIEPDDQPKAGVPVEGWFEIRKKGGDSITAQDCSCSVKLYSGKPNSKAKPIGEYTLSGKERVMAKLMFPSPGPYTVRLVGQPKKGSKVTFAPFQINWPVRATP
jgi:hypothetical protein